MISWILLSDQTPSHSIILDADEDTQISVESTPDEDKIRFYIAGYERWNMVGTRVEPKGR